MKKLQRILAMLMTVIMTAGTITNTGFTVFAADAEDETVSEDDAVSEDEAEVPEDEADLPGDEAELPEEEPVVDDSEPEDDEAGEFNIWVGGERVTTSNYDDIGGVTGTGAKASYDVATSTLTLKNVTGFEKGHYIPGKGTDKALIYAEQSITISGDIDYTAYELMTPAYGIYIAGKDNTLTLNTTTCKFNIDGGSIGTSIATEGDFKTGKNLKDTWFVGNRYSKAMEIGGSAYFSYGDIQGEAGYYGLVVNGDIHMEGGNVLTYASGKDDKGYGIYCKGDLYYKSGVIEGQYEGKTDKNKEFGGFYIGGEMKVDWDKAYINTPYSGYFKDHNFYWNNGNLSYSVCIDEDTSEKYNVWVGGVRLSKNKTDDEWGIFGIIGGTAGYNKTTKTLTLDNVKGISGSKEGSWIYAGEDITVVGNASFTSDEKSFNSIIASGNSYNLTVKADIESKLTYKPDRLISSGKNLTLDGAKINGIGTTYGVYAANACTVKNSTVKVTGDSCGVFAAGNITISDSDVDVTSAGASDNAGVALKSKGNINVESGSLVAKANANNGGVAIKGKEADDGLKINKEKMDIVEPEGASISNGTVLDKDNKPAAYVKTGVVTPYDVWVGNTRVTDKNRDDVLGNGKIKYYPTSQTLEFDDLKAEDLTDYYVNGDKTYCIYADQDLQMIGTAEFYGADYVIFQSKGTLGLAGQFDMRANVYCYYGVFETWLNFYGGETVMSSDGAPVFTFGGATMYGGEWRLASAGPLAKGIITLKELEIKNGRFKSYGDDGAILACEKIKLSDEVEIYEPEGGKLSDDEQRIVDKYNETAKTVIIDKKLPTYTVAFNMNEHGTAPATQNVREGYKAVEPEAPVAAGWIFAGWYEEKACINRYDFETPVTGPITLYACWLDASKTYYKVSFDLNGHGTSIPPVQNVEAGAKATEPAAPFTTDEYDFAGWCTDKAGNDAYSFDTPVNADIILYAKWVGKTKHYTVSFDLNGKGSTPIASQTVEEGQTATVPAVPEDSDYSFTGWYTEKECVNAYDFATPVTANITLYAGWGDKVSALNPVPMINAATTELYLVKGQKFTMPESGWESTNKKFIKISKKGVLSAKKVTEAPVEIKKGERTIKVTVVKPAYTGKIKFTDVGTYKALSEVFNVGTNKIPVALYSNNPTVVYIAGDKIVPVGSGSATLTAYVNGKAYSTKVSVKETTPDQVHHMYMTVNDKKTLSVKGVKIVEWTSSDDTIVKIDKKKAVALKTGYAQLEGKDKDGKVYYLYTYVEDPAITATGITPAGKNKYTVDLKKGESAQIVFNKITQWPVIFKSSKGEIAYADENGKIHAQNVGKSKLTVKINGKTITIKVNVTE